MGDSKGSFSNFEQNECKKESVKTPDLLGDTMTCKASNDLLRSKASNPLEQYGLPSTENSWRSLAVRLNQKFARLRLMKNSDGLK